MRALFALDLDEDPEDVDATFTDGRLLLDRLGATVDLLFVDPGAPPLSSDLASVVAAALGDRRAEQEARLRGLLSAVSEPRRGRAHVVSGNRPADAIVVAATKADLVVVGTHRREGLARLWLGSVAEKVARASPIPVLVLTGPVSALAASGEARALAAVDLPGAESAVAAAGKWAAAFSTRLDALHVVPLPDPLLIEYGVSWAAETELGMAAIARRLDEALARLPAGVRGTAKVERGLPGRAVASAAEGYLLAIVGTHGNRGLSRLLLGSVAERIVRSAPVPVLVLPLSERIQREPA